MRGGVAVITGSATGLGFAVAQQAAAVGMHVCLTDVRSEPLAEAASGKSERHGLLTASRVILADCAC